MLRSIVVVVASYILMTAVIVIAFMALWIGMGPNRLLEPGTWKGGLFLSIAAPTITVVAGLLGGWVCAKFASGGRAGTGGSGKGRGAVLALAALVLVLGGISAAVTLQKPYPSGPRDPNMTTEEFFKQGREPSWLAIFNPIGGAAAVLVSGMLTLSRRVAGGKGIGG